MPKTPAATPETPVDKPDTPPTQHPYAPVRAPSLRVTAALAGAMLALGVVAGAAIGPAPTASLAGIARLPIAISSLTAPTAQTGRTTAIRRGPRAASIGSRAKRRWAAPSRTQAAPRSRGRFSTGSPSVTPMTTTTMPRTSSPPSALAPSTAVPGGGPSPTPPSAHTEEANPNNYSCFGSLAAGTPEAGSDEQQVAYTFHCNGPITGYQLQSQIPLTGVEAAPLVSNIPSGTPLTDTFSCSSEVPGYADNCVGATKTWYETIAGQFSIGTKICAEPRVDALLTVTYAYLEKGVPTQAISGPFDLGRPQGCPADAESGWTRLNPKPVTSAAKDKHKGKKGAGKGKGKDKGNTGKKTGIDCG